MKKFLLSLAVVSTFFTVVKGQEGVTISGKLINASTFNKVYLEDIIKQTDLDSATIDESGNFNFKSNIEKSDFYKLRFSQEYYLLLVLNPGEKIEIEADLANMYEPKIKGSKNSELVYSTFVKMKEFDEKQKQLVDQIEKEKKDYLRTFILDNLSSLSSLFFIESLSLDDDKDVYQKLDESLFKLYPNNYMVKNLHDKVKSVSLLEIGSEAPEIDLPGVDGKNIKLSSLRGKYVLIDFWAAWCGPCRRESPNMVEVYKKYNKKGFEIYSVSLDKSKDAWTAAIEKDNLGAWAHVSDLKYWNSIAAKDYGVDGIPFTVLLDKEGKIVEKGLRGDKLKDKLAELFD
ncbi:MAG: AhpC/TSA family protein [Chloroflexia bacterium]|nr:AhpC/TSA family protein [Chloroflexia bacterium]